MCQLKVRHLHLAMAGQKDSIQIKANSLSVSQSVNVISKTMIAILPSTGESRNTAVVLKLSYSGVHKVLNQTYVTMPAMKSIIMAAAP